MLNPNALAWQNVVNRSFKLSIMATALASIGIISGCSSTPQKTTVHKSTSTKQAALLDSDSLSSLEDLLYATDMRAVESDRLLILRHGDVWRRMTVGFKMNLDVNNPRINNQRSWFISRQPYLNRLSARASRYIYYTVKEAERRGIPTEIALLPIIESSYDPAATSSAAAAGLWQFIPSTGRIYGLRQSDLYDGRRDVVESTRAAYEYLSSLYNQFGSWELALASYNAGPGRIQQAINRNRAAGLPTDYWSLRLPEETMNYVPRFIAVAQIIKNPHQFGVDLPPIANRPHFREVTIPGSIDLDELARITNVSRGELYALNPGHRGNYTDPMAPSRFLIPNEVNAGVDSKILAMRTMSGSGGLWAGGSAPLPTLPAATRTSSPSVATTGALTTQTITRNTTSTNSTAATTPSSSSTVKTNNNSQGMTGLIAQVSNRATPKGSQALASFAANADVPSAPRLPVSITPTANKQISIEPPISQAEKNAILVENTQLNPKNVTPSKETQIVQKIVEPAPTESEKLQVVQELEKLAPKGTEIVDPLDGKIKLTAIQSSQSIAEQTGQDVKLTYAYPKAVADAERKANTETLQRNLGKPVVETRDEVVVVAPQGKRDVYTVQTGDTLAIIATRFGVSWRDIAAWNQINPENPLFVGTRLYLYNAKPEVSKVSDVAAPIQASVKRPERYTVKAGDSLTSVAQQYDVSLQDLAAWNNLTVTSNLMRGQHLVLNEPKNFKANVNKVDRHASKTQDEPKASTIATETYTVKRGEFLQQIAQRYALSNAELAALTPNLTAGSNLLVGQKINVPRQQEEEKPVTTRNTSNNSRDHKKDKTSATMTYTVVAGDYLSTVAAKHKMTLAEIAELNNLTANSNILVGQRLKVNADKSGSISKAAAVVEEIPQRPNTYVVQNGETLSSVARKFDLSLQELADFNFMKTSARVQRGTILKLQADQKASHQNTKSSKTKEIEVEDSKITSNFNGATESYSVKSGESLTALAGRYKMPIADLAGLNKLKSNASLRVGQTIKVPKLTTSYKVKTGDNLNRLARKYGVTLDELAQMNDIKPTTSLQIGQTITVPNS